MPTDFLALESLVADIAGYANRQIKDGDLSGPRFGAFVKLAWFGQSGDPCYSDCQNIINALQMLRGLDDNSDIDTFYVAITASMVECFPHIEKIPADINDIRTMSARLLRAA